MAEYFNYSRLYYDIFGNGLMPLSFPYCIDKLLNGEFHQEDTLTDDEKFLIREYHKFSTCNQKIRDMSKGIRRRRYYTAIRKLRTKCYRDLLMYGIVDTITAYDTNSFWDIFDQLDKSINRHLARAGINTITDLIAKSDNEILAIRGIGPKKLELINQVKSKFIDTNKMANGIKSTKYVVLPAELQFQIMLIQHDIPMDIYLRLAMNGVTTLDGFAALKSSELKYLHNDFDILCKLENLKKLLTTAKEDK